MKLNPQYLLLLLFGATLIVGCGDDDEGTEPGMVDACSPVVTAECTETQVVTESLNFEDEDGNLTPYDNITIQDRGEGTGTVTWSSDNTYELNGLVFVNEGQTLTIEPGTVIKGQGGQGERASALVVARGGRIEACGTADNPIIFTSVSDNTVSTPSGVQTSGGLGEGANGLWGGVIILGSASTNTVPVEQAIEGIPTNEPRGAYGGSDDDDNSGTFKYVSIRHGGTDIGAGNEINGLTMGGVGSGTTIEYVEVFANKDDGFEWFGGTVNSRYLVSAYNKDDAFDYDQGWRGNNQFWITFQQNGGDRGGEHDGGTSPEDGEPFAIPVISNATYVGQGSDVDERLLTFRDNAGGKYFNSIFSGYNKGVDIEYLASSAQDSYQQFLDGNLEFTNNTLFDIAGDAFVLGGDDDQAPAGAADALTTYFQNNANTTATDPTLTGVIPSTNVGSTMDLDDDFFEDVDYRGAVEPGTSPDDAWYAGWTRLATEIE